MDPDYGLEDDGPFFPWLPPEDRLWRHPSEIPPSSLPGPPSGAGRFGSIASRLRLDGRDNPRVWAVAVVAGMIGALTASGIGMAAGAFHQNHVIHPILDTSSAVTVATPVRPASDTAWAAIDNAVAPAVVGLSVQGPSGLETGSGVMVMQDGSGWSYVVTDRALLTLSNEPAAGCCIEVTFQDGKRVSGVLVGQDTLSGLAVIAVSYTPALKVAMGTVATLHETESVIAVPARTSSPYAVLTGTVSGESVKVDLSEGADLDDLLAVSPAMPNGTSGSPLVDQDGKVVGITLMVQPMESNSNELTFAVPIDEAMLVTRQMVSHQPLTHPWLGIAGANDVPSPVSRSLGIAGGVTAGSVVSNSPASQAGIRPSDIIYSFDGHDVATAGTLTALMDQCQPEHQTTISFIHNYKRMTRKIVVKNEPNDS